GGGARDLFGRSEHGWWVPLQCCDAEPDPVEPRLGPLALRLAAAAERVVADRRPGSPGDGRTGRSEFRPAVPEWLVRPRLDHIARRMRESDLGILRRTRAESEDQ